MRKMKSKLFTPDKTTEIMGIFNIPSGLVISTQEEYDEAMKLVYDATYDSEILTPTKVFDDLWYIGTEFVGVILLKTDDGLVMIDALNHPDDLKNIIKPGMETLGLDPNDIKLIIITHGHYDHYGAAKIIKETYGCKVAMSSVDYDYMLNGPQIPIDVPQGAVSDPKIDIFLDKDEDFIWGGTTFKVLQTPGHTPGGISLIFPMTFRGEKHMAGLWGGTALGNTREEVSLYIESVTKFIKECDKADVDVSMQAHGCVDYSLFKGYYDGYLNNLPEDKPNPMILGKERFMLFANCIKAAAVGKLEVIEAEAVTGI